MKVFVFCFLILNTVNARAEESTDFKLPIEKGNWSLGIFELATYDRTDGGRLRTEVEFQYFVADRWSLGVTGFTEDFRVVRQQSLGLVGTYYFYELARSAFYISQSVSVARYEYLNIATNNMNLRTTLGYNYFVSPNIAVGPRLQYEVNNRERGSWRNGRDFDSLSLGFGISAFF